MPGTMFQEVVSSRADSHRRWYTLPLSFLVHTTALVVLVVIPLVATDVLPMPRTAMHFIDSSVMPVVPTPPPALPRQQSVPNTIAPAAERAPVVAPDAVGPETGVLVQDASMATQTLDGVIAGLGSVHGATIEAAPAPQAASDAPVRLGGDIKPPARIRYVAPVYPEIARRARVEGIVIVEAIIGTDGRVDDARILRPHPLLDDAALAAVREWRYTPTLLNGRPTAVIMVVTVHFGLN